MATNFIADFIFLGFILSVLFYIPLKNGNQVFQSLCYLLFGLSLYYFFSGKVAIMNIFLDVLKTNFAFFMGNSVLIYAFVWFIMKRNYKIKHHTSISYNIMAFVFYMLVNLIFFKGALICVFFLITAMVFENYARQSAATSLLKRKGLI